MGALQFANFELVHSEIKKGEEEHHPYTSTACYQIRYTATSNV
jgi:hypothetical protein